MLSLRPNIRWTTMGHDYQEWLSALAIGRRHAPASPTAISQALTGFVGTSAGNTALAMSTARGWGPSTRPHGLPRRSMQEPLRGQIAAYEGRNYPSSRYCTKPDDAVEHLAAALRGLRTEPRSRCLFCVSLQSRCHSGEDCRFHLCTDGPKASGMIMSGGFLQGVPEDILAQISVLLCLEPGESAPLDVEFHEPTRSYLMKQTYL